MRPEDAVASRPLYLLQVTRCRRSRHGVLEDIAGALCGAAGGLFAVWLVLWWLGA
jgi:hypothetical protein